MTKAQSIAEGLHLAAQQKRLKNTSSVNPFSDQNQSSNEPAGNVGSTRQDGRTRPICLILEYCRTCLGASSDGIFWSVSIVGQVIDLTLLVILLIWRIGLDVVFRAGDVR